MHSSARDHGCCHQTMWPCGCGKTSSCTCFILESIDMSGGMFQFHQQAVHQQLCTILQQHDRYLQIICIVVPMTGSFACRMDLRRGSWLCQSITGAPPKCLQEEGKLPSSDIMTLSQTRSQMFLSLPFPGCFQEYTGPSFLPDCVMLYLNCSTSCLYLLLCCSVLSSALSLCS